MLDEDDDLIRALNSQAIDSLEEAGDEAMEDESTSSGHHHHQLDSSTSSSPDPRDSVETGSSTQVEQDEEEEGGENVGSGFSKLKPSFSRSSSKRSITATNFDARRKSVDPEEKKEKLEALIQEFGESPCLRGQEPEKLLADCPAVLMRTVLIKGSLVSF